MPSTRHQPAHRFGHAAGRDVEVGPALARQHPRNAAFVQAWFQCDVDADDDDQERQRQAAEDASDRTRDHADTTDQLPGEALDVGRIDGKALCLEPDEKEACLLADDRRQLCRLLGDLRSGKNGEPQEKTDRTQQHDGDSQAPPDGQ
jgi:hypothetical protein